MSNPPAGAAPVAIVGGVGRAVSLNLFGSLPSEADGSAGRLDIV